MVIRLLSDLRCGRIDEIPCLTCARMRGPQISYRLLKLAEACAEQGKIFTHAQPWAVYCYAAYKRGLN
jgi:hypothetical protein